MATNTVKQRFEVVQRDLDAVDLAALSVASRPLAKRRDELEIGDHKVWAKLLITGGITVGEPVATSTAADYLGVLAWVLARLPARQRAAVAAAVAGGAEVSKADREAARAVCEPTKRPCVRAGALTGVLQVDVIR